MNRSGKPSRRGSKTLRERYERARRYVVSKNKQVLKKIHSFNNMLKREFLPYTIAVSVCILIVLLIIDYIIYSNYTSMQSDFPQNLFSEFNGMLLDILVFGVVIAWFVHRASMSGEVERQQETIDDFKKWNSDEAKYRIGGAIRRLNKLGVTKIDFGGLAVTDFSFPKHDVQNIRGSTFYDGTWGMGGSRDEVLLEKVDFSRVDCRDVVFSKFDPFAGFGIKGAQLRSATLRDCYFQDADLSNAIFNGAYIEWTWKHPEEIGEYIEVGEGHEGIFFQNYYPPFSGAILKGTLFIDSTFNNADFRDADILECDFTSANGLETCLFDSEEVRAIVIEKAALKKPK